MPHERPGTQPQALGAPTGGWSGHSLTTVADFDSLQQLRLWLRRGPGVAMGQFVAMLRTALLVGERVYVDRNQLLDGICFLSLGPRGMARVLGLEPEDPLPLLMGCSPVPPDPGARTPDSAHGSPRIDLAAQLAAVRGDTFCSAALTALVASAEGGEGGTDLGRGPTRDLWSLFHDVPRESAGPAADGDGHRWAAYRVRTRDQLETAREEWAEALSAGRLETVVWPMLPEQTASFWTVSGSLEAPDGAAACAMRELKQWSEVPGVGQDGGDAGPVPPGRVPRRGEMVALLAAKVREARECPEDRRSSPVGGDAFTWDTSQARAALRWWSLLYYDAVLNAHWQRRADFGEITRIAFWDTGRPVDRASALTGAVLPGDAELEAEIAWGLRARRRSRWRFMLDRLLGRRVMLPHRWGRLLSRALDRPELPRSLRTWLGGVDHRRGASAPRIRVEGEVIAALARMDPVSYRILLRNELVRKVSAGAESDMRAWFDVALAVRDCEPQEVSWARRTGTALLRFSILLCAAVLLALNGADVIPARTSVELVLWTVLAVAAAFPVDDCLELFSMRPAAMTSTIRVREADDG